MEDQDYIQFEDYLSGKLTQEEVALFEERIKTDASFSEAFNTYKELSSFLTHKFEKEEASEEFKQNLQQISKAHFATTTSQNTIKGTTKTYTILKYLVAACVVVIFGIFTLNRFSAPNYSDYADYNTISLTVRGVDNALLQTAEDAFNTKDFKTANESFKLLLEQDKTNLELQLYRGIANIELNNFEVADGILRNLKNGTSVYKHKATWYLALSKLKQNNTDECLKILKEIPEEAEDYHNAQELIDDLE